MIRLFHLYMPTSTLFLLLLETCAIATAFTFAVYQLGELDPVDYLVNNFGLVSVALVSCSFLAGMYFQDLYSEIRVKSKILLAQQLLMVAGTAFLVEALISALAPDFYMPLREIILGSAIAVVFLYADRLLFSVYVVSKLAGERLLLIGGSPILDDLAAYLEKYPELGIRVAAHVQNTQVPETSSDLEAFLRSFQSTSIVASQPTARLASELLDLRFLGLSIEEATETYAKVCNRESLVGLRVSQLCSREFEPTIRDLFFQDLVDRSLAAICLIILSPVMLLLVVLRLCTGGPVWERRSCTGQNGVPFTRYRFRLDQSTGSPSYLNRFLLRTGFYALPQLFNVLSGKMAIVGPLPHSPEFIEELTARIPFYPHRFKVRPGVTGLAQIRMRHFSGPPDTLTELEYDLYYFKHSTRMMSVFIVLQSIKNVLLWGGRA